MTVIRGTSSNAPGRNDGGTGDGSNDRARPLGIHSVEHFALEVPDLAVAADFYAKFGLDVHEDGQGLGVAADGGSHRWGRLSEGSRKRLHHVSFGCFEEDLDALKVRAEKRGATLRDGPPGHESNGVWFDDPDGNLVEIRVAPKRTPDAKVHGQFSSSAPSERGATYRRHAPLVRPRRLAHLLFFTPDVPRAVAFYEAVVGLRLTDRSEDIIAFMHAPHGSDHHVLAFAKSSHAGFHHASWDVDTVGDVGLGAMRMAEGGYAKGWGLGRHVLGSNYFHYVQDPWGSFSEYSCDIDYIPADTRWESGEHPPEDSLYLWGPDVPEIFTTNYEAPSSKGLIPD